MTWHDINGIRLFHGDTLAGLREMPDQSVHCCVTSPPYFGLRDYGVAGQHGLEETPDAYVEQMVEVFREVRRVLRDDGTLWLNLGDSYAGSGRGGNPDSGTKQGTNAGSQTVGVGVAERQRIKAQFSAERASGLKPKDLIGIPWRVAFALQADGWYLRQDIIWCLSGGAWVYARTQKGDMPVMVKDLVRLKPETVKLWNGAHWTQVLGWNRSTDTSERLELVLRSGERIGCTGSHRWPTQRGNIAARDLLAGDVIQTCVLPEQPDIGTPIYLTPDLLWLIGLYLAEGSRAHDTVQLSLHADEAHWLRRIEDAADGIGASMTYTRIGNSLNVRLYGRVLVAAIEEFVGGRTATDKHLRAPVWMRANWCLRKIAEGYLDGDGHWDKKARRWRLGFTRNYALERDLRTLAARLGAVLTLHPDTATYQGGQRPSFRGEWRWIRSGHHNEKERGEVIEIRRSRARQFWDIGVADEPHLFALASGVLTHNSKPNPMPESVTDRCTKAHEHLFLLSKSERYYYDQDAIKERAAWNPDDTKMPDGLDTGAGGHGAIHRAGRQKGERRKRTELARGFRGGSYTGNKAFDNTNGGKRETVGNTYADEDFRRNKRSVWTVGTKPFKEAHFATFPPDLITPCILAGAPVDGVVLDPYMGSGTTAVTAYSLGRNAIGCELNGEYLHDIAIPRIKQATKQQRLLA